MTKRQKQNRKQIKQRLRRERARLATKGTATHPASAVRQGPSRTDWAGPNGRIGVYIVEESKKTLDAYQMQPNLVIEHANHEEDTARGGYARRQLFELVQNGADALAGSSRGRIFIKLSESHFYCADDGQPIDTEGVRALMFSHLSPKRGTVEIGRFGLGFKSVLGVTDAPEFFSHSGSFRFDRAKSRELVQPLSPDSERYPVLRLPEAVDPWPEMETDPILRELMSWAVNIVRLPLKPATHAILDKQMREFPPEFLLFVEHVSELVLQTDGQKEAPSATGSEWLESMHSDTHSDEQQATRRISLRHKDGRYTLDDGKNISEWMLIKGTQQLSSDAKSDRRSLDDSDEVPISWAVPIDRLNEPGRFWAFFPTMTTSLLAGILNAPWKTNEDRQNLLPGVYNDELIDAAASMVARALPQLSVKDDPASHLDALPRREEAGDSEHSNRLRERLYSILQDREIVPDQNGRLRRCRNILYPPKELIQAGQGAHASFKRWAGYSGRPTGWLHHSTLNRNRQARLERLLPLPPKSSSIAQWLTALLNNVNSEESAVQASMAAIQTAVSIPKNIRARNNLGKIVLTADVNIVEPDPSIVYLNGAIESGAGNMVHPFLQADHDTLVSLKELGLVPSSSETAFRELSSTIMAQPHKSVTNNNWHNFWSLAREINQSVAGDIVRSQHNWRASLRVRTIAGNWRSLFKTLLPGRIVPLDGSRDADVAIDIEFHLDDLPLLKLLGVADIPRGALELSPNWGGRIVPPNMALGLREYYGTVHRPTYQGYCRTKFAQRAKRELSTEPRAEKLIFTNHTTSGPLDVLQELSDEARVLYTWELLKSPDTYKQWTMLHSTQPQYGSMDFESPAVMALRQLGRIKTDSGVHDLSDGIGDPPKSGAVRSKLLSHPLAQLICDAFDVSPVIANSDLEPIGDDDPIPLVDVWPGLQPHLATNQLALQLIRCDDLFKFGNNFDEGRIDSITMDAAVYVRRQDDERQELQSVAQALSLELSSSQIQGILIHLTPAQVQAARNEIRACSTDEERLLTAVGAAGMRARLPQDLIAILEDGQGPLSGIQLAEAAIATYHTGALREYRHALGHLNSPKKWAGTHRAVEFVRSLGFGEEWAGERKTQRDPFIEVDGPYSLPNLHSYQRRVVDNARKLLRFDGSSLDRRGMVSMPTGSGKTRVAVQSIVEAIREEEFRGGVLWVADRDELCEQAVEAWRQVWSSEGSNATQLRISRMWAGQPRPLPSGEMHVVVATIQTLSAKISKEPEEYAFLNDFKLLVFDEAHRSVAPTFTSVMEELGLTRWRRAQEPFLIGLTATPYRGHDESETRRLVNRYGSNRLDTSAFANDDPEEVIRELQTMRILARADHVTIEGGHFSLSYEELQKSKNVPWLPQSVEARIASDVHRTRRIVEAYMNQIDPNWPTLIFATSVEHSQTVAALLTSMGIKARAVSGATDTSTRRRVVEEFRAGEVKALVNYGVFREGFDAPRTRAIIVARPVYSPNLYFQMIGRGLRGVKNGGNDRCLILNVEDNIENFKRRLAFSELDWLWD